jgi:histidinol-phosphate aminotransferase
LAQVAAISSLENEAELLDRVEQLVTDRTWFESEVRSLGFDISDSQANFVWLELGEHSSDFANACFEQALAVRPFAGEGVRISIGERAGLERALTLLAKLDS